MGERREGREGEEGERDGVKKRGERERGGKIRIEGGREGGGQKEGRKGVRKEGKDRR